MINLLPPEEKKALILEKNRRLTIVLLSVVLIFLICLALVLLSLKFYILQELIYQKDTLNGIEKEYKNDNFFSLKNLIQKYNLNLSKVDNFYKQQIYFNDVLKTVSVIKRPSGLYFTNVNIEKDKEINKLKVNILGISDSRDNLLVFKDRLENNNKIENIYFPAENWIKTANVNFKLSFEVQQIK